MGGGTSAPLPPERRALLEEYLRSRRAAPRPAVPRRSPGETVPLSSSQEQVWLHAQLAPDIPVYNEAITIHYDGPLDVPAFGACFREIVGRHEAWRTGFVVEDGRPTQRVHDDVSVDLPFDDLRGLPDLLSKIRADHRPVRIERAVTSGSTTTAPLPPWRSPPPASSRSSTSARTRSEESCSRATAPTVRRGARQRQCPP